MLRSAPLLCLALIGCAAGGAAWPTLETRPTEVAAAIGRPSTAMEPAPAADWAAPAPAAGIDDVPVLLATIERDMTDIGTRLERQRAAAAVASAAAREARPDGDAWSRGQLELTRLERVGSQIGDLRTRLDAVAGTLAAAATRGSDVTVLLKTTGGLIARTSVLDADYTRAFASAAASQ